MRTRNLSTGENVQRWTRYFLLFFSTRPSDEYDTVKVASTFGLYRLWLRTRNRFPEPILRICNIEFEHIFRAIHDWIFVGSERKIIENNFVDETNWFRVLRINKFNNVRRKFLNFYFTPKKSGLIIVNDGYSKILLGLGTKTMMIF